MKGIIYLIFIAFSISCNITGRKKDKGWSELPEITSLQNLKQTGFVTTLESPVPPDKNIIYAPAFLFAWDKIVQELKSHILVNDTNSNDFRLLINSKSHIHSLTESDYSAFVTIANGAITARAFYNKALPFDAKLQLLNEPVLFNKTTKVVAFGMNYFDEEAIKFAKILYYQNDDNFILQLTPKDKQQEIVLVKAHQTFKTLADALRQTNLLIDKGENESKDSKQLWKYEIAKGDIFSIPTIKFNIATNYETIEGERFFTKDNKKHFVAEAYQRTGFILNENGATVESKALAMVDSVAAEPIIKHPKNMIFDKPFLVIVKRKEYANPYFVMTVSNSELLTRK